MLPIRTVLHPTDFSDASEHGRRMAYGLARDYGARLVLLHAVEPSVLTHEVGNAFVPPVEVVSLARERIAELVEEGSPVTVEPVIVEGLAAPEILRAARDRQADLVVIGSHGRTGLGRVLMGSVAEEVARKSPCPVLIVRPSHGPPHETTGETRSATA